MPSSRIRRRLDWPFTLGVLAVALALGVGLWFLQRYQFNRNVAALHEQARRFESEGNLDRALEDLQLYLRHRTDDQAAWSDLARWSDRNDPEGRRVRDVYLVYKEALRRNPEDRALRDRATSLALEIDRPGDAAELIAPLLKTSPDDPTLRLLQARCLAGQDQPEQAADLLRSLLDSEPTQVDAYVGLAELLRGPLRRPEEAPPLLDRMVAANPESAAARLARWRFLRARPETRSKADPRDVTTALELAPHDADSLRAASEFALEQGQIAEAHARLQEAARLAPNDPAIASSRVALELRDGRPQAAVPILREAIRANPRLIELPMALTDLLIDLGQIEGESGARAQLAALRRRGLNPALGEFLDGRIAAATGRWGDALRRLTAARDTLQRDPLYAPRVDRAILECQERLGLRVESLATLERLARAGEIDSSSRLALAEAYTRAGRLDRAAEIHRLLLPTRPESYLDLVRLATIAESRKLPQERRWDQVLSLLNAAEKALPPSPELTLQRAAAESARGRSDSARDALESGLSRFPESRALRVALARSLAADHPERARAILDEAPGDPTPEIALARLAIDLEGGDEVGRAAVARLESQLDAYPAEARLSLLEALAWARLRLGDLAEARAALARRIDFRDSVELRQALLDIDLQRGDRATAETQVQAIRALEGDVGLGWRHAQARIALDAAARGDARAAEHVRSIARAIVDRRPDSWIAPAILGRLAEIERRDEEAATQYRRALQLNADAPEVSRRLVALLYRGQRFQEIDEIVGTLAARGAANDELRLVAALNAIRFGQTDTGLAQARELLPESSRNPFDLLFLARILAYSGRLAEAERPIRRAVELAPRLPEPQLALIELLTRLDKTDEARRRLEQLPSALDPADLPVAQARAHDLLGEPDQATALFDQAVAARPNDPATLRAAAESAIRQRRDDRARAFLDALLDPKTAAPADTVAWARRSRGFSDIRRGSLEQIDDALQVVEKNLKANPFSFDDQRARALLLAMRPSRRDDAIRELERLEASRLLSDEERFLLAMLHGSNRDLERCDAQMRRLLASPRRTPAQLAYMVVLQLDRQRVDDARTWLAALEKEEPGGQRALQLACRLLDREGSRDALRRRLLDHAASKPADLPLVAALLERHGFLDQAEAAYRQFAAEGSDRPARTLLVVEFLGRRGRVAEALDLAETLRTTVPPSALLAIAVPATLNPDASESDRLRVEAWLDEALTATPADPILRLKRANLRLYQGRGDEARSIYAEILTSAPDDLEALNNLAWQLAFQDDQGAEALRLIDRAIENFGPLPALLDTRAVIRLRLGEHEPALRDLRDALAAQPDQPLLHFHLAWAQQTAGNPEDARQALRRARELGLTAESTDPLERPTFIRLLADLAVD